MAPLYLATLVVAFLGDDAPAIEVRDQFAEGLQFEVAAEDGADGLGLSLVDDELLVPGVIAERDRPAGPFALAPASRDLVPYPLGGQFPLELGKGEEHVEGQPSHGRGGVELLGDGHKGDRSGIKGLDQLGEVGQRTGEAVDLVDDHDVDPAGLDIGQQLFQGRAVEVAAGIGRVVVVLGEGPPALRGLALDIGLAGLPLGVQRIELLLQAMLGGFAGVDRAAQRFGLTCHRRPPWSVPAAARRTGARSIWCR